MNKIAFQIFFAIAVLILFCPTDSIAQKKKRNFTERNKERVWFIARVINTEPFMLEYLDDWYRHQPSSDIPYRDYQITVDTNPQSQFEKVDKFKLGDIISGEFCNPVLLGCGAAVRVSELNKKSTCGEDGGKCLPPSVALNLKKLDSAAKTKYQKKGYLITYKREDSIIRGLEVFRDGTIILDGGHYFNGMVRRLPPNELEDLKKSFLTNRIDKIPSDKSFDYSKPQISAAMVQYQYFIVENHAAELKNFISRLDRLIDDYLKKATYSLHYRWRFQIKDWQFGDIFPLDQADDREFLEKHWQIMTQTMASAEFFEEAKERYGDVNPVLYRYKGEIYGFVFPICTNRPTGSWACFRVWKVSHTNDAKKGNWLYDDWPANLQTKLKNISPNSKPDNAAYRAKGFNIPASEFEKNSEFFSSFIPGNKWYKEGDYIYADLTVKFR